MDRARRPSLRSLTEARQELSRTAVQGRRQEYPYEPEARRAPDVNAVRTIPYHSRHGLERAPHASKQYLGHYDRDPLRDPRRGPVTDRYSDYGLVQERPPKHQHTATYYDSRPEYTAPNPVAGYEQPRYAHDGVGPGYGRSAIAESQASFFMSSHYDYSQGKTRKRSNLPKQSTEIMKNWFDQVSTACCTCHENQL
jgi:hypothetical protein